MAAAVGAMQAGEAVRLECLSRTFDAEVSEVRAWTWAGASIAMVAVITRGRVPKRELPPGERVTLHAADGSRWEGAIGGSLDSAASIVLKQSPETHQAVIPHDATDLLPAQDGVAENQHETHQAVIPHDATDLLPAQDGVAEDQQVLEADTQQVVGAQRGVCEQPQDFGVPLVPIAVPRPVTLNIAFPPVHNESAGKARDGKNFRLERKKKSAEKGKYG